MHSHARKPPCARYAAPIDGSVIRGNVIRGAGSCHQ
ncbi:hypothetical protein ISP13_01795 [Dyella lipolytica]|uniref:Uncharacterized protein n=1 Tax=Dyella lipolytica TaxID=1867835 RepID=A0ABW8IQL5_9GAMM